MDWILFSPDVTALAFCNMDGSGHSSQGLGWFLKHVTTYFYIQIYLSSLHAFNRMSQARPEQKLCTHCGLSRHATFIDIHMYKICDVGPSIPDTHKSWSSRLSPALCRWHQENNEKYRPWKTTFKLCVKNDNMLRGMCFLRLSQNNDIGHGNALIGIHVDMQGCWAYQPHFITSVVSRIKCCVRYKPQSVLQVLVHVSRRNKHRKAMEINLWPVHWTTSPPPYSLWFYPYADCIFYDDNNDDLSDRWWYDFLEDMRQAACDGTASQTKRRIKLQCLNCVELRVWTATFEHWLSIRLYCNDLGCGWIPTHREIACTCILHTCCVMHFTGAPTHSKCFRGSGCLAQYGSWSWLCIVWIMIGYTYNTLPLELTHVWAISNPDVLFFV